MSYPNTIDSFREVQDYPGVVVEPQYPDTIYAQDTIDLQEAIVAIETELGTEPSGASASVKARLDAMSTLIGTLVSDLNMLNDTVAALMLPIGSLYYNADSSTNPATLLGYGTWVAFGQGRVVVGKAANGTFSTAGATGGSENHIHTNGSLFAAMNLFRAGNSQYIDFEQSPVGASYLENRRFRTDGTGDVTANSEYADFGVKIRGDTASGSSLQPYIVVYAWKRTA